MRRKTLVECYLLTLAKLFNAKSVNLHFDQGYQGRDLYSSCFQGDGLLPEFDQGESQTCLPCLTNNPVSFRDEHSELTILRGKKQHSLLVYVSISTSAPANSLAAIQHLNFHNRRQKISSFEKSALNFWLGFDFDFDFDKEAPHWLMAQDSHLISPTEHKVKALFECLLQLGGLLLDHLEQTEKLLTDPLTLLSGRIEFQDNVAQLMNQYARVALILINPEQFQKINEKFGHKCGDRIIDEIANNLTLGLRKTDLISRFGGALFAIATPIKNDEEVSKLLQKLQGKLQNPRYLGEATKLTFNIGVSLYQYDKLEQSVAQIIAKAEQALLCAQTEPDSNVVIWHPNHNKMHQYQHDNIGGIFTADTETDYRNMLLLWDISNLIASHSKFETLLSAILQRLKKRFTFANAGLIQCDNQGKVTSISAFNANSNGDIIHDESAPTRLQTCLLEQTKVMQKGKQPYLQVIDTTTFYMAAVNQQFDAIFFIAGQCDELKLDNNGQLLLFALAKQLGLAITRSRLESQLSQQLKRQGKQLKSELAQLKQSVQSSHVIYRSQLMQALMTKARRAAMTDVTTLIIGESGTGKERLVHAMQQMGPRRDKPFVIVDCGAIPEALIESELFGHVKGAYTGAQSQSQGRVLEASGGTLMLDEIGELPLLVQSKLLRFVQEKQFTPVGGIKSVKIDVKIIAVTNRQLEDEVALGHFRADLFYRLKIIELHSPALRERSDDIELLAKQFLHKFSLQFDVPLKFLSTDAMQAMQDYHWPGNVRELENRLMQATLLSDNQKIEFIDLNIACDKFQPDQISVEPKKTASKVRHHMDNPAITDPVLPPVWDSIKLAPHQINVQLADYIAEIKTLLTAHIEQIVHFSLTTVAPVGRWLGDDLIVATYRACDHNARQAALRLGMPHSTLRRRVDKIETNNSCPVMTQRTEGWQHILDKIAPIIEGLITIGDNNMTQLKLILLASILEIVPDNVAVASALMGVSEPTLYKWKKTLETTK